MPLPRQADAPAHVDAIVAAAVAAAHPRVLVPAAAADLPAALSAGRIGLVAAGKAAAAMTAALPDEIRARVGRGVVVAPAGTGAGRLPPQTRMLESDHPLPTGRSVASAEAALEVAEACGRTGMPLLVLLSGGASAMLCAPEPGLSVEDIALVSRALMRAGATIDEVNTVRIPCDRIKGGGLARAATPSPVHALILSDVVSGRADLVGSGPTMGVPVTPADALAVLRGRRVQSACAAVTSHLRFMSQRRGAAREKAAAGSTYRVIGDNRTALAAGAACARELGFEVVEATPGIGGESRECAFALVAAARRHRARLGVQPFAMLWGGETTVSVRGKGRGGRNLEAALAAAIMIEGDPTLTIATFATDGQDGTSDGAGATVSGITAAAARRAGVDPEGCLEANDSHGFFERAGGMLRPGPTGTNVNDLWIVLGY